MKNRRTLMAGLLAGAFVGALSTIAAAQTDVNREIVPTGTLRVGINGSNATLFARAADGSARGLSVDLGTFIAGRLGVPFEPVIYPNAAGYTTSFGKGEWDIIVTGRNPLAGTFLDFLQDVILIDYVYLAGPGRAFADLSEIDRTGVKIGVPGNASADAFLRERVKSAQLVRLTGDLDAVTDLLRDGTIDPYATGIDNVLKVANRLPGSKIVGRFDTVAFAVSIPKGLSTAAKSKLTQLVNEAKEAGLVRRAIDAAGLNGVRAASD